MAPPSDDNDEYYTWDLRLKESVDLLHASGKRLQTYGKKVREKRRKEQKSQGSSKHIKKWTIDYNDGVGEFSTNCEAIIEIYNNLPKSPADDGGFQRRTRQTSSLQPMRRGQRRSTPGHLEVETDPETSHGQNFDRKQEKIWEMEDKLKKLKQENENLTGQVKEARNRIELQKTAIEQAKKDREQLDQFKNQVQHLRKDVSDLKAERDNLAKSEEVLIQHLQEADNKEQLDQFKNQVQHLRKDVSDLKAERDNLAQSEEVLIQHLQEADNKHTCTMSELRREKQEKQQYFQRIQTLQATIEKEKEEKDDALRRLSALVSSRIRDNNINIVDLSDENRPTKLSEVLSEIYDNEWTDCYDQLGDDDSKEADHIGTLLEILMNIYKTCLNWSTKNYFESIQRAIDRTYMDTETESMYTASEPLFLPEDLRQPLKELKKSRGLKVLPTVQKLIKKKLPELFEGQYATEVFQKYIRKCTEFSWLAVVQDPPLALNADPGAKFNTSQFREYMKRGEYVDFVVWPALHIKEGGPLLMKGVAQGTTVKYNEKGTIETPF